MNERDAFEAEMKCKDEWGYVSLERGKCGEYENYRTSVLWAGWKARAATAQERKPLTDEQIAKALAGAGLLPEDYREDGMIEPLVRAIEAAHGIK